MTQWLVERRFSEMLTQMASLQTQFISAVAVQSEEVLQLQYEFGKVKTHGFHVF